jgi:D-alanyl-D-alanine carboxypeptidase
VGYVDAANGHRLIFAVYVNMVPLHDMDDVAGVGETLCQIAALAYQYAPLPAVASRKTLNRTPHHDHK